MKFKSKEDLMQKGDEAKTKLDDAKYHFNCGVHSAFSVFKERITFYEKYRISKVALTDEIINNGMLGLQEDYPEIYKLYRFEVRKRNYCHYNNWLFKFCFGDIK